MNKFLTWLLPTPFDCGECLDTGILEGYGIKIECFFCEVVN